MSAAEYVQRQKTIMIIVTMEKTANLVSMNRVIDKKYGMIDTQGTVLVPFEYEGIADEQRGYNQNIRYEPIFLTRNGETKRYPDDFNKN